MKLLLGVLAAFFVWHFLVLAVEASAAMPSIGPSTYAQSVGGTK
jgi:hypothetical protein